MPITMCADRLLTSIEIRNKIYWYCTDAEPEDSRIPDIYGPDPYPFTDLSFGIHLQRKASRKDYFGHAGKRFHSTSYHVRQFHGLAQVDQQVRREFLPLYTKHLDVHIWLPDVEAFSETFLSMGSNSGSGICEGKMTIKLPLSMEAPEDLTSLIRLCRRSPDLKVVFESPFQHTDVINDYNRLFGSRPYRPYAPAQYRVTDFLSPHDLSNGEANVPFPHLEQVKVFLPPILDDVHIWAIVPQPELHLAFVRQDDYEWVWFNDEHAEIVYGKRHAMAPSRSQVYDDEMDYLALWLGIEECEIVCGWRLKFRVV